MVFLLHDINDGFLEAAKMANYAGRSTASNTLFIMFVISWVATRLTYFPLWVIWSCLHEPIEVGPLRVPSASLEPCISWPVCSRAWSGLSKQRQSPSTMTFCGASQRGAISQKGF